MTEFAPVADSKQANLIRLGGAAILLGLAIHIVLNMVLKEFPPKDLAPAELREYLSRESSTWAVVHGCRYLAFTCIVLFAAGLYTRTGFGQSAPATGWSVVGLLGTAVFVANGIITNGIEMLAFLKTDSVSKEPNLFWLLFELTRGLFTAEIVTWSIVILGFSVAGWQSTTLPRWITLLGLVNVAAGMLSGVFIVSILNDGWSTVFLEVASLTGLAWFAVVGIYLLIRGES